MPQQCLTEPVLEMRAVLRRHHELELLDHHLDQAEDRALPAARRRHEFRHIDPGRARNFAFFKKMYGDCRKGNRPSFSNAAAPEQAEKLYEYFVQRLRDSGLTVATGQFKARMEVTLVNDGPVTFIVEN